MVKEKIKKILDILEETYPEAECALDHKNVFQLLIAVVLSAQTTDKAVNVVTPELFARYPSPDLLAYAEISEVEECIKRIGMYHQKAKNIIGLSEIIVEKHSGKVPNEYDELIKLPGVGRKTANVVLSVGFGEQRIAVDTHVFRVSNRIGIAKGADVLKTELSLMKNIPEHRWTKTHHSLIFHGRNICSARKPDCPACPINELCEWKEKTKK